jgi:hypothetical protein
VQLIFRASNKPVSRPGDYLTGAAHPTVFEAQNLDRAQMVRLAHELKRDQVPPLVLLKVVEEDKPVPGRDFFDVATSEALFTTPCAIARVMRSTHFRRRMVVSAEASRDANGRPLKWHWVVLRGDPDDVRIKPMNAQGSVVELSVPHTPRRPVQRGAALESSRIDIGAFVHNGTHYSAPAFVSFFSLDHEERDYDRQGRIRSVIYRGADEPGHYVDPMIALPKSWRDKYRYDRNGQLAGWTRIRGSQEEEFTPEGRLLVRRAAPGRPAEARAVWYTVRARGKDRLPVIEQVLADPKGPSRMRGGPEVEEHHD